MLTEEKINYVYIMMADDPLSSIFVLIFSLRETANSSHFNPSIHSNAVVQGYSRFHKVETSILLHLPHVHVRKLRSCDTAVRSCD